ncbi:MAG: hypothetical protein IKZ00_08145 [Bacteroidaceae bacterium]|nr:hypothetical protein [Bacteroidaceae bacterium]
MCDPQQELFSKLKKGLEAKGFAVYDGFLPPEGTPYPFVYLGDSQQTDDANKSAVFGNVFQTIHVWHNNPRQRGTVSQILLEIKLSCRLIEHTDNFAWNVLNVSQQIIPDNTTSTPLLHGVLDVEWKFN